MFIKYRAWFHSGILIQETDSIEYRLHHSGNKLLAFVPKSLSDKGKTAEEYVDAISIDSLISITTHEPSKD